jgi:hypothetical protein
LYADVFYPLAGITYQMLDVLPSIAEQTPSSSKDRATAVTEAH